MNVIAGRAHIAGALGRRLRKPALAIGNFDGVHLGHRKLLEHARRHATELGGEAGVLTFDPHPARFFKPALAPPMLMTVERRLELLAACGLDFALVEPFDRKLAQTEAETFVSDILVGEIGVGHVVVGYDFSFGRGRRGNADLLAQLGAVQGFGVDVVPPVTVEGLTCSSTKVREFVLEGRVGGAEMLLGRPFEVQGHVVKGAGRGRGIGVPTANLAAENELLPRPGIYAATAEILSGRFIGHTRAAAVSVGTNPTFTPGAALSVEAHLLDFDDDLYGARMRLGFLDQLRDEERYDGIDALVAQIRDDVARTRAIFEGRRPGRASS